MTAGWILDCMSIVPLEARGFALIIVLVLLAAVYAGATGIFVASRAELRAGTSLAEAEKAFHAAEGGLVTWFADPVQAANTAYEIGGVTVQVEAVPILVVDSATVLYHIIARAEWRAAGDPTVAVAQRTVTMVGVKAGAARAAPVFGTWRERFWR